DPRPLVSAEGPSMPRLHVLFRCLGEALCARGLRALAGLVPFGDGLYDVAADAFERLRHRQREDELRAGLEEAAGAALADVKAEAAAVALEVAADQPEPIRNQLAAYLVQVPAAVRRSFKRPADPSGTTV